MIWAPSAQYTLAPLSSRGLWLAVIISPAAARSRRTAKARTGVGTGAPNDRTRRPAPVSTAAASAANGWEPRRASKPMTTGRLASSGPAARRYRARPAATRRTVARFIRPGPAPSGPRMPAVPNVSGWANRAASSPSSPACRSALSSARSAGSGSSAIHARAAARSPSA